MEYEPLLVALATGDWRETLRPLGGGALRDYAQRWLPLVRDEFRAEVADGLNRAQSRVRCAL